MFSFSYSFSIPYIPSSPSLPQKSKSAHSSVKEKKKEKKKEYVLLLIADNKIDSKTYDTFEAARTASQAVLDTDDRFPVAIVQFLQNVYSEITPYLVPEVDGKIFQHPDFLAKDVVARRFVLVPTKVGTYSQCSRSQ
jgi:hypothetical protein